jgi:hypothetical protein
MIIQSEEIPLVNRPLTKAERTDLIAMTNSYLEKASRRSAVNIAEMDKFNRKATIYFVQACYGFYIIQELCKNESQLRQTILKYFPKISIKRALIFAHIGEYFNFNAHYYEFLKAIEYSINPGKSTIEDIDPQLQRLEEATPPLTEVTTQGLEEYFRAFRPGNGKTVSAASTSATATAPEVPSTIPAVATQVETTLSSPVIPEVTTAVTPSETETIPESVTSSEVTVPVEVPAESSPVEETASKAAETESLFNEEDLRFDKQLDEFIAKISFPAGTVGVFDFLKGKRPLDRWNPVKVARIREVLLPAKVILDQLGTL